MSWVAPRSDEARSAGPGMVHDVVSSVKSSRILLASWACMSIAAWACIRGSPSGLCRFSLTHLAAAPPAAQTFLPAYLPSFMIVLTMSTWAARAHAGSSPARMGEGARCGSNRGADAGRPAPRMLVAARNR